MKIYLLPLLLTFSTYLSFGQNAPRRVDALRITDYLSRLPMAIKVSMSVEGMEGEEFFSYRPTVRVPAASVIKIPILIELMEKVKAKQVDLNKVYTLQASDKAGGSGVIANLPDGKKFTIRELAQEMIRSSDNTATNILIRQVGMADVNQNLMRLGSTQTRLNRIMMDTMAVKQGRENYVNTIEINDLLRMIYNKEVATPALCDEMIEILKNCGDTTTIPRNLPKDVVIAHKTGGLPYVRGDAAIVYTKKPFIISIFVEGFKEESTAERIISDLAKICWENLK